jgi:hypothetical protein
MSAPTKNDHGHASSGAPGAPDEVRYDMVVKVGVASLVIFALSIWWAAIIMKGEVHEAESKAGRARLLEMADRRPEIGMVDQVPFVSDQRLHAWRRDRRRELETYTWVDKSKGVVRIPIEEAMDKVAAGAMPAGAPK